MSAAFIHSEATDSIGPAGRASTTSGSSTTGGLWFPCREPFDGDGRQKVKMPFRIWLSWLLLLTSACVSGSSDERAATTGLSQTTATPDRTSATTTLLAPPPGVDLLVAETVDEFDDVAVALDVAAARWASAAPDTYAYRVRVDCECVDRGTAWVRVFDPDWPDEVAWDVEAIYVRISKALERTPDRIEVAFDPDLGIPVWFAVDGNESEAILVEEFHEITFTATPYDGFWRFVAGEVDGELFSNPTTGLIFATLRDGFVTFPIDCNEAGGPIDVHGSFFGIGSVFTTGVGCSEYSEEGELFSQALQSATTIGKVGAELVISGENSVLRLVPLERPEQRGELALTAAGETLVIDVERGELTSILTVSSGGNQWPWSHPGRSARYTLTPVDPESDQDPAWSRWEGEVEVPDPPSGPQEIVVPDDIGVGDYQLCSPYWSGDFFCYDLLVRPASAPWYVTAGADGVVLHDADTTSQRVWEGDAQIAFWFDDLLVVETATGAILGVQDSQPGLELSGAGSRLLDAIERGKSKKALIVRGGETLLIDVDRGDETVLAPAAIEGRLAGDIVVLRPSPEIVEGRSSTDGAMIWRLEVDAQEMISSVTETEVRLDSGHLNTDGPVPFWQYLETRVVDTISGTVVDEFRTELAIPLEGDEVTETCIRAELRDGLLLCPQPDGRFATIEVEGGDQQTIAGVSEVIATYIRKKSATSGSN